ncbi:MAG: response regulator [Chthoniobacter sp.]
MLRASLEKEEFIVVEAGNGVEALEKLATLRPALILLDLMMPEMDGFQFTKEVRAHADWHDIPILVMTAKDIDADDRALLDGQVSRILQKGACAREDLLSEISHRVARCARPVEIVAA